MQGDATVIQHLNAVLRNEMTAINQYFLHSRMLDHWGVVRLGAREYEESVDEMKHRICLSTACCSWAVNRVWSSTGY